MIKILPVKDKNHVISLFKLHNAYLSYSVDDPNKLAINMEEPFYHIAFIKDRDILGFSHYHKVSPEIAEVHFCIYEPYRKLSMEIAEEGFNYLREKGFKQLITFTPKHLRHVKLFALRCGFKPVPQVPTMTEKKL